jgi:phosphate uptake regulator
MKRKIIKQGNGAFTLTLPIEWIRKNRIDESFEVELREEGKSIIVNSGGKVFGGKVKVDFSKVEVRGIYIHVSALYAKGIDEIEVSSEKDISQKLINACSNTLGYALVSQEGNKYIIKDMGGQELEIDEIFKRVFQMILMFYDSSLEDIYGKQEETNEGLILRDREINKFCLYLQRSINKMSYQEVVDGRTLFTYSFELEKISDEIQRLWRTSIKYNIKKSNEIKNLMKKVRQGLNLAFDSYFQFNLNRAEEIRKLREGVRRDSMKIKSDVYTTRFIRHLVKIIEEVTDLSHLNIMMNSK